MVSEALEAAAVDTGLASLSPAQLRAYQALLGQDSFLFGRAICNHASLVPRFHAPLSYAVTGSADRLAATLSDHRFDSKITDDIRSSLRRRGIDWTSGMEGQRAALRKALRRLNVRMFRSSAKSTVITVDGTLFRATRNPNITLAIASYSDPGAQTFCETIGTIIQSDAYERFFPHRVPSEPKTHITKGRIWLEGRTLLGHPQWTIEARGTTGNWTRTHYDIIVPDDIVGTESKGEADLTIAREFMATMPSITMPEEVCQQPPVYIFVGTTYAPGDDASVLAADPNYITIDVPIEIFDDGFSLKKIWAVGRPTFPEWYDEEKVQETKSDVIRNNDHGEGALSWVRNYILRANTATASVFDTYALNHSDFEWLVDSKGNRLIKRLLTNADGSPKMDAKGEQVSIVFDPRKLYRTMGVDQSFSPTGDLWAVAIAGADHLGTRYELDMIAGQGYEAMLDAILTLDERWDPIRIGIEADSFQQVTLYWMQLDDRYRSLWSKLEKVSTGSKSKEFRFRNVLAAGLTAGTLKLNPENVALKIEAEHWRSEDKKAKDGRLDALTHAIALIVVPGMGMDEDTMLEDEDASELAKTMGLRRAVAGEWLPKQTWLPN